MKIDDHTAKELGLKVLHVCMSISMDVHSFLGEHKGSKLLGFNQYPISEIEKLIHSSLFDEFRENIDFFRHSIPKYKMDSHPDNILNYNAIFSGYPKGKIDITLYQDYQDLKFWINENPKLKKLITRKLDGDCNNELLRIIIQILSRYLYTTCADETLPANLQDLLKPYVLETLKYYLAEKLPINICVPICLASFDQDKIELSETVEIVRIPEELQKARQNACTYEVVNEDWVAACATHMIVFHNYNYKNNDDLIFNTVTQDYNQYPLKEIDEVLGIIRLISKETIGYEQILIRPIGWLYNSCADLPPVYGAKAHFVNASEIKKYWMTLKVAVYSDQQCNDIKELYKSFKNNEDRITFALMRYNRCMLRNDIDDMLTDACIGLESLLSGETKSEIAYTLSNRIPIVFSKLHIDKYPATYCRGIMNKIYTFRSKIVHGSKIKNKDKYAVYGKNNAYLPEIALEFLRYTLFFMIKEPEYLDPKKIDEYIDSVVSSAGLPSQLHGWTSA